MLEVLRYFSQTTKGYLSSRFNQSDKYELFYFTNFASGTFYSPFIDPKDLTNRAFCYQDTEVGKMSSYIRLKILPCAEIYTRCKIKSREVTEPMSDEIVFV